MSKTIDEKVVEMKFDNKNFEANVQTSLSTLDKLKAKLNLTGASKGLEEVNKATKNIDFSHIESSLAAIENRFSTMGIVGMTVIQNLTNSVWNLVSAAKNFTLGGITSGGKARATKIENARFQIKGLLRDFKDADKRLSDIMEDVNYGVESTAYGLDAAATVAAQLVASGMEAGDGMKAALRGISGVAAMTNSSYEDIGRIYTTVAGNGRLMGDQLLQLSSRGMNAAAVLGKALGKSEADVRKMVSKGQIDFATFSKAMDDAFGEHAKDANKTLNGVVSNIRAALAKIGADFFGPIIAEESPLVKFLNSVRNRINEIRQTLSPITEDITNRINKALEKLNKWFVKINPLSYTPFQKMSKVLETLNKPLKGVSDAMSKVTKTTKDYEKVVNEIIMGKWKNAPTRWQQLTKAGYDWAYAQNLVNEKLGSTVRHTTKFKPAADSATKSTEEMTKESKKLIAEMAKLSEEELKAKGYTKEQIEAFKLLKDTSNKTGLAIEDLLDVINKTTTIEENGKKKQVSSFNTRFLILNSLKNIGLTLISIFKSVGKAFADVFNIKNEGLFDVVAGFHKLTQVIKDRVEGNAEKLTRTLRGLFSILHIIATFITTGIKLAVSFISGLLGKTNLSILDITANIGDAIYEFDKWITSNNHIFEVLQKVGNGIRTVVIFIKDCILKVVDWIKHNEKIMAVVNKIRLAFENAGGAIGSWIQGLKETDNIPKYIFSGLIKGLKKGATKVYDTIGKIAEMLVTTVKTILGIASPAKVFIAIGGFIIAGLIKGMADGSIDLLGFAKDTVANLIDVFKNVNFGNIIAISLGAGLMVTVNKIIKLTDKLFAPLEGLGNLLTGLGNLTTGLGDAAADWGKGKKYNGIANIIKSIAITIGVLVAAIMILGKLPAEQLKQGGIALGVIAVALLVYVGVMKKLAEGTEDIKALDVGKILASILGTAVAIFILAGALKKLSKIEPDRMGTAILGLIACAVAMALLLLVLKEVAKDLQSMENIKQLGKVFTNIAASMVLVAVALKIIDTVSPEGLGKAGLVVLGLIALLGAIAGLNKISNNSIIKSAETIKAAGTAMLLLVIATKLAGMLKPEDFAKALGVIAIFAILLLAIMGISKLFPKTEMIKITGSLLMAVVAIGLLAIVVKLMSNMDPEAMKKGLKCVGILSAFVFALIAISRNNYSNSMKTLLGIAIVIGVMAVATFLFGQMDPKKMENGLICVGILTIFMEALLVAGQNFSPNENAFKTLLVITGMLALLIVALIGLSFLDPARLINAAESLGLVMAALAAVIYATGKMKTDNSAIKTLLMLTGVIAILALIVAGLAQIPNAQNALKPATAVSELLIALAAVAIALDKFKSRKKMNTEALKTMYALLPLLLGISVALLIVGNAKNAVKGALALTIMMGAMVGLTAILGLIGKSMKGGLLTGALGILALCVPLIAIAVILSKMDGLQNATQNAIALSILLGAMTVCLALVSVVGEFLTVGVLVGVIGLYALVGVLGLVADVLAKMDGLKNAIPNALALSMLLTAMSDALFKLALVAPLALIGVAAIAGLVAVIVAVGALATAIGILMKIFPQLEQFLDKGIPIMVKIAAGIGEMVGALIANFMGKIADELPHTGEKLSEFMTKAMPFIVGIRLVNDKVLNGVKILAKSIIALTGANLLDAAATWLSGGQSFNRLGGMLSEFITGAEPFITMISKVKPQAMEGAKNLAQAVLAFTAGNFIENLSNNIFGESDYGKFGEQLGALGKGLSEFVANLKGFDKKNLSTIEVACEGIKKLTDASKDMPKEGGVWQKLVGTTDMGDFGDKMPLLANGLVNFCKALDEGGFNEEKVGVVETACKAIKQFVEIANSIPAEGGVWQKLAGEQDLGDFAKHFPQVGEGIAGFVNNLQKEGGLTNDSKDLASTAVSVMYAISNLANLDLGSLSSKFDNFGNSLPTFGEKISEFVGKLKTVNIADLNDAATKMDKITELASKLSNISSKTTRSFKEFSEKLENFAVDAIKGFIKTINDTNLQTKAENAINTLLEALIEVMKKKEDNPFKEEGLALIKKAVEGLENTESVAKAKEAGENFAQGFINGMDSKMSSVYNKAYGLGSKANIGLNAGIDSHSPSKLAHKSGNYFGEGFIIGIKEYFNRAYNYSRDMGDEARNGLSRAIANVSKMISNGIDDDITIRPVLDLSNVESGVASMNRMFNAPSIGVTSNLNAISSGMRNRQNGGENVVDAINQLGKNLGNTYSGDTYNINGVTYDDGSNISEAVRTLVHAAKIERRT